MKNFFLTLILAAFCGMSSASAYDFSAVCPTGQTLYYNITDAVNHEVELVCPFPWGWDFDEPFGEIVFPATVTNSGQAYTVKAIGDYAFYSCDSLIGDLIIPNSVTSIGVCAFFGSGFTGEIVIPESVTSIGELAFSCCYKVTSLTFNATDCKHIISTNPYGVTSPFSDCSNLKKLTIGESVQKIPDYAFAGCDFLEGELIIPNSVTSIGDCAFFGSGFTGEIVIPEGVASIGGLAFSCCYEVTSLTFNATDCTFAFSINPYGVEFTSPFSECWNLKKLTIGESVQKIPDYAFAECDFFEGELIIPNSVASIGNFAFYNCRKFSNDLIIPNSVTWIGKSAFEACKGFSGNLTIGDSVTSIGDRAFCFCSGFKRNLTIGDSVTSIGERAFYDCCGFQGTLTIGNSVTSIGDHAFEYCSEFRSNLVIPNSVTSIGKYAFNECNGFWGKLVLSKSIIIIDTAAFRSCSRLYGDIDIPNSVSEIRSEAFLNCNGFNGDLILPNSVEKIEGDAFKDCAFSCIKANCNEPPVLGTNAFEGLNSDLPIQVPYCAYEAYQTTDGWSRFTNYQQNQPYRLIVKTNLSTMGTANIIQEPDCENDAIVEAVASEGYAFLHWTINNEIVSYDNPYTFTLSKDTYLRAIFSGLGVDDHEMTKISLYPNPTNGIFTIKGEDIDKIEVYNAQGQLIRTQMISGDRAEIDLSNVVNGLYLVRIMSGKGTLTERKIVKN